MPVIFAKTWNKQFLFKICIPNLQIELFLHFPVLSSGKIVKAMCLYDRKMQNLLNSQNQQTQCGINYQFIILYYYMSKVFQSFATGQESPILPQHQFSNASQKKAQEKARFENRPISFTANIFSCPDANLEDKSKSPQIDKRQERTLNVSTTAANTSSQSLFATFARADSTEHLPYFQELEPNENGDNEQLGKAESYSSNFMAEIEPTERYYTALKKKESKEEKILFSITQEEKEVDRGKMMESEGLLEVSKEKYKNVTYKISDRRITIQEIPLELKSINKLKLFAAQQSLPKHQILKLTMKGMGEQLFIGLKKSTKYNDFPLPYFTFAKIVIKKLKGQGIISITNWDSPERKPTCFYIKKPYVKPETSKSKAQDENKPKQKEAQKQQESAWRPKEQRMVEYKAFTFIHGRIYKKSKHLGHWQRRYVIINQLGFFSYRNEEDENASVQIKRDNIKYIWTNFSILVEEPSSQFKKERDQEPGYRPVQYDERQFYCKEKKGRNYLIVKVKHGIEQTQFGIPILNFDTESVVKNWLFGFYRVLPNLN